MVLYVESKGYPEEQTVCNTSRYVQFKDSKNPYENYFKFPRARGVRAGDVMEVKHVPNLKKSERKGTGNRQLRRINFSFWN